jgi:acetolactate synthase-1/2/3 large subunit
MHNNAVATAVEYDLPVVWIIFNNTGYVSIRDLQKGAFGKDREFASRFRRGIDGPLFSADFAMMARSMGAEGIKVERPGDLGSAVQAALASRKPTVIDVIVESEVTRRTAGVLDFPPMWGAAPNYDPDPL